MTAAEVVTSTDSVATVYNQWITERNANGILLEEVLVLRNESLVTHAVIGFNASTKLTRRITDSFADVQIVETVAVVALANTWSDTVPVGATTRTQWDTFRNSFDSDLRVISAIALTLIATHTNSVRTVHHRRIAHSFAGSILLRYESLLTDAHVRCNAHSVVTSRLANRLTDVVILRRRSIPFQTLTNSLPNAESVHAKPIARLRITHHLPFANRQHESLVTLANVRLGTPTVSTVHQTVIADRLANACAILRKSVSRNALTDVRLDAIRVNALALAVRRTDRLL